MSSFRFLAPIRNTVILHYPPCLSPINLDSNEKDGILLVDPIIIYYRYLERIAIFTLCCAMEIDAMQFRKEFQIVGKRYGQVANDNRGS